MSVRPFPRLSAAVIVLCGAVGLLGPAVAQFGPEGPVRIGIILPEPPDGATAPWEFELASQYEHGAILGEEEISFNAELLGVDFAVLYERATGPEEAVAAAERLLEQGAFGIAGGYTIEEALALGAWAEEQTIPFMNLGVQSDLIRNDMCSATTFHIEASAAMYIDSLAGWYVRDGFRRWYVVSSNTEEGARLQERLTWALEERHFGVREVEQVTLTPETDAADIVSDFDRSGADLLVLLIDPAEQLEMMSALEEAGFQAEVAGYPYPATQTRQYFLELLRVAPSIAHYRAALWEPTLDTSGAIEFNLRHRNRWEGQTMDGPSWSGYHAVKVLYDSATFSNTIDGAGVVEYLESPNAVIDLHKLLAGSFRPWDHQLRQSLYLSFVDPNADSLFRTGLIVGQLPALYLPGTDPLERLDQIGDLAAQNTCNY